MLVCALRQLVEQMSEQAREGMKSVADVCFFKNQRLLFYNPVFTSLQVGEYLFASVRLLLYKQVYKGV